MRASPDRILTAHVGSLPRPKDVADLLRPRGEPIDDDAFDATIRDAIRDAVRLQTNAGLDIVVGSERSRVSVQSIQASAGRRCARGPRGLSRRRSDSGREESEEPT